MDPRDLENFNNTLPIYTDKDSDHKKSESLGKSRREVCLSCDKLSYKMGLEACSECGCLLSMKVIFKYSKCPLGKWEKVSESN